jgi:hypothetical protein
MARYDVRKLMIASTFPARFLLATAALVLPLLAGGCGRTACFTWSAQEGQCPAQSEALAFFSSPTCPGQVIAVDSEATSDLDGQLCCYEVTARARAPEENCQGFGGASSSGRDEASAAFATSVGPGGFGGQSGVCLHCPEILEVPDKIPPCESSAKLFDQLITCACFQACSTACADSFCQADAASPGCAACMKDSTSQGCGEASNACASDF